MLSRLKHPGLKLNFYPAAALVGAGLFGAGELIAPLLGGIDSINFDSPVGFLAIQFALAVMGGAADLVLAPIAFQFFIAAKAVLVTVYISLLALQLAPRAKRWPGRDGMFIVGQLMCGLAIDSVALSLIVAAQLAACMPRRRALGWLALLIGVGMAVDLALLARLRPPTAQLISILVDISLERAALPLGFAIALIVRRERQATLALAAAHAELLGTQALLGDAVRSAERLRIARDLHDVVGHHLTALNLHLDLALRQSDGKAAPALSNSLQTSRTLAHDMLAEVRAMVGSERRDQPVDLHAALASLCAGIPHPRIALRVDPAFATNSAALAHTLFCCVQEAITNAVRHAQADHLAVDLTCQGEQLVLAIADDGRGSSGHPEGNGLRGMRERLLQHGGHLAAHDVPDGGFRLAISLPRQGAPA